MPPTPARRVRLAVLAALLAAAALVPLLAPAPPAGAAQGDRKAVTLRGRVSDESGAPLADVRVEASGTREAIALTSPDGRFTLTVDLGTLFQLRLHPAEFSVRARQPGYAVRVSGGAPELAVDLRLGVEKGEPVLQARSNFGIIADALLDALAPPGDRTAVIQVSFVARRGAERDSSATVPIGYRSVPIAEPWLKEPVALATPATPRTETAQPKPEAPQARPERVATPPEPREEAKAKPRREPDPPRRVEPTAPPRPPAAAVAPPRVAAAPALSRLDSLRLRQEAEQRAAVAAAQARRDSLFRIQRAQSLALKAVTDSVRAVREAAEDSLRRARFGLPPRPAPAAVRPAPVSADSVRERRRQAQLAEREERRADKRQAAAQKLLRKREAEAAARAARSERAPAAPDRAAEPPAPETGSLSAPGGLRRVEVRTGDSQAAEAGAGTRTGLEADSCTCRVRGTVETEFHRLLASPLRLEVSIRELPALRDTIELFMGSPRAFEFPRVPCGRWSLALRPFSERPFGVTNPESVAPFDCRQRGLRQVRIVIAPLRNSQ